MAIEDLTEKELETIRLIEFDYTYAEMARELGINEATISKRICTIGYKLGIVKNREKGKRNLKRRIKQIMALERMR